MQNGRESNGRMRDELQREPASASTSRTKDRTGDDTTSDGRTRRGHLTPVAYAANLSTTRDRLRNPDQLRRSHVAPPAPHRVKPAKALIAFG